MDIEGANAAAIPPPTEEQPSAPTPAPINTKLPRASKHLYKLIRINSPAGGKTNNISSSSTSSGSKSGIAAPPTSSRSTTRAIAALDFLQHIPFTSDKISTDVSPTSSSIASAIPSTSRSSILSPLRRSSTNASMKGVKSPSAAEDLTGRRLDGPERLTIRIPSEIRYRLLTKYPRESAVVRRWERSQLATGLHTQPSRLFLSQRKGYPIAVTSILQYYTDDSKKRSAKFEKSNDSNKKSVYDWKGTSYRHLMVPYTDSSYDPNFLDDPGIGQGRHRQVLQGDVNVGPIICSVLTYVTPSDLKAELNRAFKERHPDVAENNLTLSKIRKVKREALIICKAVDVEIAVVALACVYFEKLVTLPDTNFVTKENRKLVMAVCIVLALKFSSPQTWDGVKEKLRQVLEQVDRVFSISATEVLAKEFDIYVALGFELHVPLGQLQSHFHRLLKSLESNPRKYLGPELSRQYNDLVNYEEEVRMSFARKNSSVIGDDESGSNNSVFSSDRSDDDDDDSRRNIRDSDDDSSKEEDDDNDLTLESSLFNWNGISLSQWFQERLDRSKE